MRELTNILVYKLQESLLVIQEAPNTEGTVSNNEKLRQFWMKSSMKLAEDMGGRSMLKLGVRISCLPKLEKRQWQEWLGQGNDWQLAQQSTWRKSDLLTTSSHRHWVSEQDTDKDSEQVDLGDNQCLTLQLGKMGPSSIKWLAWGLTVSGRAGTRAKSRSNPLLKRIWHSCEGWRGEGGGTGHKTV